MRHRARRLARTNAMRPLAIFFACCHCFRMLEKIVDILLIVGAMLVPISFLIADWLRTEKEKEYNDNLHLAQPIFDPDGESPFKGLSFVPTKAGNPSPAPMPRDLVPESDHGFGPCYMVLRHERFLRRTCGFLLITAGTLFAFGVILPQSLWGLLLVVPGVFCFVRSFFTVKFMRDGLAVCLAGITIQRHRYDAIIGMRQYMRGYRHGGIRGHIVADLEAEQSDYDAGKKVGVFAWWNVDLRFTSGDPLTLSVKAYPGLKQALIFWLDNMA